MIHELKVHPQFWDSLESGAKPFEVRLNDRKFAVGDVCELRYYDPQFGFGNYDTCHRIITYMLRHEDLPNGVPIGYVVLGFGDINAIRSG